jgi:2-oxoisovalerate dehydrogenase E1 component
VPGLTVGLAAPPDDAYATLRSAVAEPDPVVVIEARALYQQGACAASCTGRPRQRARVHLEGSDVAIFTWGTIVRQAIEAADRLVELGIHAGVVVLRSLNPLDDEAIERAVRATEERVLIVHEANVTGGVAARVQEEHFDFLDQPVARLGIPDVTVLVVVGRGTAYAALEDQPTA